MTAYDFRTLSHLDFDELVRDVLQGKARRPIRKRQARQGSRDRISGSRAEVAVRIAGKRTGAGFEQDPIKAQQTTSSVCRGSCDETKRRQQFLAAPTSCSSIDEPMRQAHQDRINRSNWRRAHTYQPHYPSAGRRKFMSGTRGWRKSMRVKVQVAVAVVVSTAIATASSAVDSRGMVFPRFSWRGAA